MIQKNRLANQSVFLYHYLLGGCIKRAVLRLAKPEKAQFTKRK